MRSSTNRRQWLLASGATLGNVFLCGSQLNAQSSDSRNASDDVAQPRIGFAEPKTTRWRIGLKLTARSTCENVIATFPVPVNWPEQDVRLVNRNVDAAVTAWGFRTFVNGKAAQVGNSPVDNHTTQIVVQMRKVAAGSTVHALFDFDVTKSKITAPVQTDDLEIFKRLPRELRQYIGDSKPEIDASHRLIRKKHQELTTEPAETDWELVERFYDYVQEHVRYVNGTVKPASKALESGEGDCEEMTSLVVALCRNSKIPARMVWVPEHCYPEFCLQDADGNPQWFPCQAAGTRQFGEIEEYRPILQKGDRFRTPEKIKEGPQRYLTEFFTCEVRGRSNPQPEFVLERIED